MKTILFASLIFMCQITMAQNVTVSTPEISPALQEKNVVQEDKSLLDSTSAPVAQQKDTTLNLVANDSTPKQSAANSTLNGRNIKRMKKLKDAPMHLSGKVVIDICVDASGTVISASQNKDLSTTTDIELVNISTEAAMSTKFALSDVPKQCGKLTYNFTLE